MTLPNDWTGRRYQQFKDTEAFGNIVATDTAGSIVLNTSTPRVGDILIFNSGSGNIYYNLGVSGEAIAVSTSGTLLEAGAKITYNDVGIDVCSFITTGGSAQVYVQKLYSSRP